MRNYPKRFHEKHGAFYYVFKNKWTPLGNDYAEALRKYATLINPKRPGSVPDYIDRGLARLSIAANTRKAYTLAGNKLKVAFEEFDPEDVRPTHFYQWIAAKQVTPGMAQLFRSVMVAAMQLAVEEGKIDLNPMKAVRNWQGRTRTRYVSNEEFLRIQQHAHPVLKAIMAISLQTGQRIGDVLKITYADLTDEGIYVAQQKSHGETRRVIAWTPDLREAVSVAKTLHKSVKGMTLFSSRQGKPLAAQTVREWWVNAVTKAGMDYHDTHMHDIRAKTGTDARKQGLDSKNLLGHKTDSAHERYQRSREIPVVQPLPMVKS